MIGKRTSGAKALIHSTLYGTAKPVPFVQRVVPQPVKPVPFTKEEFSAAFS
jgi:hypothetical protein